MDYDMLKNIKLDSIPMATPNYDQMFRNPMSEELKQVLSEEYKLKAMAQQAQIDESRDIAEMKGQMSDLIDNQRIQIEQQQAQIERQEKTIDQLQRLNDTQTKQLQRLYEILTSIENGTAVDEETLRQLVKLMSKQPGWKDFIADKGADIAVGGMLAAVPQVLKLLGFIIP